MSPTSSPLRSRIAAACTVAVVISSHSARADYTWLGNDTTFGGSGTWDNATTPSWSIDGVSTTPVVWAPNNIAAFLAPGGAVTVDGVVQGVQGLKFSAGYTLPATNGGTLSFPNTAAQQYTISLTGDTSIAAVLGGGVNTSSINKTGTGTLT